MAHLRNCWQDPKNKALVNAAKGQWDFYDHGDHVIVMIQGAGIWQIINHKIFITQGNEKKFSLTPPTALTSTRTLPVTKTLRMLPVRWVKIK
jgi:hypothetical protein